jgi:small-conductance mechanosensitive channel
LKSDVFLRIWDKFRAHGIEIPYPQRELHVPVADNGWLASLVEQCARCKFRRRAGGRRLGSEGDS